MVADNILKYMNAIVDGRGFAGKVTEVTPPDLAVATEEFRAGGMDQAIDIDVGLEKMTSSMVFPSYDPDLLALFGVKTGATIPFTIRGSLEDRDGTARAVVMKMRGKIVSASRGTWGPGAVPSLTVTQSLVYYSETIDGRVINEIDAINMVRIVDGVDQLAEHRKNIGL